MALKRNRPALGPHPTASMKTFPLFVLAAATVIFAEAGMAQDMSDRGKAVARQAATSAPKAGSRTAEILKRFDKNKDGRLDDDERAEAHETMLQEQMAKEAPPPGAQGLGYFPELALELFDRNHNGQLDEDERTEAGAFVERGDPEATREALRRRFDQNRDGKLDDAERRESAAYAIEHRGELMREVLFKRYDANGNGQLEPEEKTAVRAALMTTPVPAGPETPGPHAATTTPGRTTPQQERSTKN